MVIVSQNKKILTRSLELSIEDIENNNAKKIMVKSNCGKLYVLGIYQTEERAKEVLNEIIYKYEHCEALKCNKHLEMQDIMKKDFTYEMPLE